ncbi:MAG: hypothetical protein ACQEP1_02590 [Nanobdellota archaeon]
MFSKKEYINLIIENGAIGTFDEPKTLKSKRKSNWYINMRGLTSEVRTVDEISDHILDFAAKESFNPDYFFGVPEGGTTIGTITQFKNAENIFSGNHIIKRDDLLWDVQDILNRGQGEVSFMGHPDSEYSKALGILAQYFNEFHLKGMKPSDDIRIQEETGQIPVYRKKPKSHGSAKDRYTVGEPRDNIVFIREENDQRAPDIGKNVINNITIQPKYTEGKGDICLIEDVCTTGISALTKAYDLKEEGWDVNMILSLTNREELTPIPGHDDEDVVKRFSDIYRSMTGKEYKKEMSVEEAIKDAGMDYKYMAGAKYILPELDMSKKMEEEIQKEFKRYGIKQI